MGWDVIISNKKYESSDSETNEEALPSFGLRQEVIDKINKLFSGIDWEDSQHGHLDNDDYFGNFDLGETEIMGDQFWLGIYGGDNPINLIIALCKEYNWTAYDTVMSEYININKPDNKGWDHFLKFRGSVEDHLSNFKLPNDKK